MICCSVDTVGVGIRVKIKSGSDLERRDDMAEEKQTQRKSGKTNRLGRDFGALFSSARMTMENVETSVIRIKINDITPNSNQPRKNFDEEKLQELADSIRANGIIQPLIVQRDGNERIYTIVAGERRWRAARMAGLDEVPAIVRELSDKQVLQYALMNIQREDRTDRRSECLAGTSAGSQMTRKNFRK